MHRSSFKQLISSHTSKLMQKFNIFESEQSSFDMKRELKFRRMEQEIEETADVDLGCYEKDTFQSRSFSEIQRYIACTRRSPSIVGIMTRKNELALNTVDIYKQFNNFFICVFNSSDVSGNQISFQGKSPNTLLITKREVAK